MIRSALNLTALLVAIPLLLTTTSLVAQSQELPLKIAEIQRTEPVDFATEIMPILKQNCLACHHQNEAEGGLVLESRESILTGGDGGSGVSLTEPASSLLLVRASGEEEPLMPPEDNSVDAHPLTPKELGLLKLWIVQGAKSGGSMTESINWQPIPDSVKTSLALAVSPDEQFAAVGQGNRVALVDLESYESFATLIDPDVIGGHAAHTDLVQAIAISPDAKRIATGGFRTVKIWKKQQVKIDSVVGPLTNAAGLIAIRADQGAAATVNAIGDIEIWDLGESQRLHSLRGHAETVSGLAWSADFNRLASCDSAGSIVVWDPIAGERVMSRDVQAVLDRIAISDDGRQLAAIDITGKLHRFLLSQDGKSLEPGPELPVEVAEVTSVAFTSKPQPSLILADQSAGVVVLSLADNQMIHKIDHGAVVDCLAVSPDQTTLFTAGRDGKAKGWNLKSGDPTVTLEGEARGRLLMAYANRESQRQDANLKRLEAATAELDKRLANEDEALKKATDEHKKATDSLAENAKKNVEAVALVTATEKSIADGKTAETKAAAAIAVAKKSEMDAAKQIQTLNVKLEAESEELKIAQADVQQMQRQLAEMKTAMQAADESAARLRKQIDDTHAAIAKANANVASAKMDIESANKQSSEAIALVAKATKELDAQKKGALKTEEEKKKSNTELSKRKQALDTATQAKKRAEKAIPAHKEIIQRETRRKMLLDQKHASFKERLQREDAQRITSMSVSPNSQSLALSAVDGDLRVFRISNGIPIASTESRQTLTGDASVGWIGDHVFAATASGSPRLWSPRFEWILESTIGALDDPMTISDRVTAIDFRPDGLSIAVGSGPASRSGEVKVFAIETGQLVRDFGAIHSDSVLGLDFAPNGRLIASSAADKTIRLLDCGTGEITRSLEGHTHHVLSVAWQDDGRSVASASADQTVKIWDTETGEQRRTISGFGKEISAVTFVAATNQLATACADGQVRLYDTSNGKVVRTFNAAGDFLICIGVTLDGKRLMAAGQSGVLRIWNVDDGKLLGELK